jgi:hypothetical protein
MAEAVNEINNGHDSDRDRHKEHNGLGIHILELVLLLWPLAAFTSPSAVSTTRLVEALEQPCFQVCNS